MAKTRTSFQDNSAGEFDTPTLSNSNEIVNVSPPQVMPKLSPKVFNKEDGSPVPNIPHTATSCSSLLVDPGTFEENFTSFLKKNMTAPECFDSSENANFTRCKRTDPKFLENNNIKFCKENIPFQDIIKDSPHRRNKYLGISHPKSALSKRGEMVKKPRKVNCVKNSETQKKKEQSGVHNEVNSCSSEFTQNEIPETVTGDQESNSSCAQRQYVVPKRRKQGRPFGSKNKPKKMDNKVLKREASGTGAEDPRYSFTIGQDVLARWNDGLFYLGSVQKIEKNKSRCFVRFEDQSEYWILFKDLQKGAKDDEISCCVCQTDQSEEPNEIVLCDNCGLGYHQACHNPNISDEVLAPDVEWCCRLCIFAAAVKEGGALKSGPDARALQKMKQSFPYKLESLTWDVQHKVNLEQCYCYCGGPGEWHQKMLQCCRCRQWFHEACIQCLEYPLVIGDRFYLFVCSHCNTGPEYIKRLEMTWVDLTHLALFNLTIQIKNKKRYFCPEDIVEFIDANWEKLQLSQFGQVPEYERIDYVKKALKDGKKRFGCGQESRRNSMYTLKLRAPPSVPTLILPLEGQVTDEVMQNLTLTGNKKVKKFLPIICKSPIPMNYRGSMLHDSIALKSRRNLSLAVTENVEPNPYSANQEYKGYSGKKYSVKSRKSGVSLSTLIPVPEDFEGYNHPFLTECEQNHEKALARRKHDLQKYLFYTTEQNIPTDSNSVEGSKTESPEPQVEPKKSRKRKYVDESAMLTSKRRRVTVSQETEKNYVDELLEQSNSVKTDMSLCFDTVEKMKKGEKYYVGGKRVVGDRIQYLVTWEGLHTK
ncbi:metal-response element-binding transcription factor 2-like [Saccostrea cucullata]|uniref:metal-response element-binding transcription factor 2-like n=1 Tax=Saccostrea cuccullata TaxID=36930 RepID=UPI002ED5A216